ncbi:hypothetical protein [Desulfallas thermosapovorans]|uniref:Uncharacterized protein n=1 Tax=Desulfallas thermosapovorans DSM 6562 TaxID=1121431 RepID=A0A5S4ZTI5_9FIRM|nr:hypothetical protein [Desulfallas thermosapovorans]TYO95503.1 hypothetical protein LX24_01464 [Desulfallas thermosapovorans DSM 6562]
MIKAIKARKMPRFTRGLAPGVYRAKIHSVKLNEGEVTNRGVRDVVYITFILDDGRTIVQRYFFYLASHTQLGQVTDALMGPIDEGEEVDLTDLIGMECRITVEIRTSANGTGWINVVGVEPFEIDSF